MLLLLQFLLLSQRIQVRLEQPQLLMPHDLSELVDAAVLHRVAGAGHRVHGVAQSPGTVVDKQAMAVRFDAVFHQLVEQRRRHIGVVAAAGTQALNVLGSCGINHNRTDDVAVKQHDAVEVDDQDVQSHPCSAGC